METLRWKLSAVDFVRVHKVQVVLKGVGTVLARASPPVQLRALMGWFWCRWALVPLLALLVPMLPWTFQRLFWYTNRPPAGQAIHVPKFLPDIHDNLVRGIPTNSFITDRRMDYLEQNFTHVPGDVWVVTYQKVGTTWTQYIVTLLLGHPQASSVFDVLKYCP